MRYEPYADVISHFSLYHMITGLIVTTLKDDTNKICSMLMVLDASPHFNSSIFFVIDLVCVVSL